MKKNILLTWACLCMGSAALADQVIIPTGSSWKYLDNGSNQGTTWRTTTFNDGAWVSGNAQLGYGDGDETTVVSYGPNSSAKYITTYFRKTVAIADASLFTSYSLQIKRDDGVVIYVNGTEVYRNNMPTGTIAYNTAASTAVSDDGANFTTVSLPTTAFVTGNNVIAVEIHQSGGTSSDVSFDLGLTGIGGGTTGNEVVYQWSGAIQPTSAVVAAKMTSASTSCRLVVSTSSTLSNPILSPNASASSSNNLMAKMTVTGLAPNTTYYYAIQSGGVTDNSSDDIGVFKTPAAGAFSYKFTVGSCAVNSNHQIYTLMNAKAPLFHLSTGDIHYANPNSGTDINVHRLPYEQNMLSQTPSRTFFKNTAMAHVWDDHDYCGNNSAANSAGRTNARLSYQEYVPHYALAAGTGNVPIYQAFTIGRVHFILSDLRSERVAGGSLMGAAQKTWFKNQCLYAKQNNLIIAWVSGVSFGGNQSDNWGGFTAERTELANFFRDNDIRNLFILSGDAHMLAIDNGSNHDFSTGSNNPNDYPVFQAAGINNSGSTKGGTYSEGGTFPNTNSSTGQYGVVEVTDAGGSNITIKFTGYRTAGNTASESILTTYTFTRALTSALAPAEFAVREVNEGVNTQLSWTANAANENWTIERSTDGESYTTIAKISARETQWVDETAATGWNFYRIKDAEGNQIGQETIFLTGKLDVTLVPNPATNTVMVGLDNLPEETQGRYIVYNMKMKTVLQGEQTFAKGSNRFQLDVSSLEAGEYLVDLVVNGREIVEKLVVVK